MTAAAPEIPAVTAVVRNVRILHVTTVAKTLGFLRGQVAFMSRRGFCLQSAGGEAKGLPKNWPLPFSSIEMPRRITPFHDLLSIYQLCRLIRRFQPTIVQGHTPKGALLAMIAAALNRVPIRIFQVHGLPHVAARGLRRALLILATRVSCRLAHRVFCVSHSMRDILITHQFCSPAKPIVLGNGSSGGVDAGKFNPNPESLAAGQAFRASLAIPADALVIGFAGRIVREKGIGELTNAWGLLRTRFPNLHLIIAGEAEQQDPVSVEVNDVLTGDRRIHLLGHCQNIQQFYAACDLVVLPTYREGFPNVLLEAAAMELPVVATRVPGCSDAVIDGMTGTLVPPYDPAALADAIARYLTDPELRRTHGSAARRRVISDFQAVNIHVDLLRNYLQLLSSHACGDHLQR
jgi:glycosyltransferase involved in cell wall biosynthesis